MTKNLCWTLVFEITIDDKPVRWEDLDRETQDRIADQVDDGFYGDNFEIETEEDYPHDL